MNKWYKALIATIVTPVFMFSFLLAKDILMSKNGVKEISELRLFGPYLGQIPPGNIPKVFAPGFISTEEHEFSCTFSADGKEFYFNRNQDILFTQMTDSGWSIPVVAEFCSSSLDNEPHITRDNRYLFWGSKRPCSDNNYSDEYGVWIVERIEGGWSSPQYVGPAAYISSSNRGAIYTRNIVPDYQKGRIIKTNFVNGSFTPFIPQEGGVVAPAPKYLQGVHPCIALDESYIIFDAMYESWGNSPELFICYRKDDNVWEDAINLSNVLGMKGIITPYISPDGKYLFFYYDHDIYWVDLNFINNIN